MTRASHEAVEQRVQREVSQAQYDAIRAAFLLHCERELAGDIDGVLKTLTADCVDQTGQAVRWRLNNMFPWDPDQRKFSGETLYFVRPESDYFVSG